MPRDRQLGGYRLEVHENERDEKAIGIVGLDFKGNEICKMGFSVPSAKDVAYKILNLCYRIENGLRLDKPDADGTPE